MGATDTASWAGGMAEAIMGILLGTVVATWAGSSEAERKFPGSDSIVFGPPDSLAVV